MSRPVIVWSVFLLLAAGCRPAVTEQRPAATRAPTAEPAKTIAGLPTADFDLTIRPQDDLYRYVNGDWLKNGIFFAQPSDGEYNSYHGEGTENIGIQWQDRNDLPKVGQCKLGHERVPILATLGDCAQLRDGR